MIYLDNAATSLPKPDCVLRAMTWAAGHLASPGRGSSKASEQADELLYDLRMAAGGMFGCEPGQVVLTTSATHGLNIAIKSLVGPGDRVVISGMEHNAVVRPLHAIGAEIHAARGRLFDSGAFLTELEELLTPDTKACILTHVSNVFGWILPIAEAAELCHGRHIPLIVDAAQSAGILPVDMGTWRARFVAMPGHKGLLGPQGTGLLLCSGETKTLMEGGTGSISRKREMPDFLPDRLEPGTPNIPGVAGLLAGIRYVSAMGLENVWEQEQLLRDMLLGRLRRIPGVRVYGGETQTGVVSFTVEGQDSVILASRLAKADIALRAGLQCAPLAHETAGTLDTGTIRASLGPHSRPEHLRALTRALSTILENP